MSRGQVTLRLVPDTAAFNASLRRVAEVLAAQINATVPAINAVMRGFTAQAWRSNAALRALTIDAARDRYGYSNWVDEGDRWLWQSGMCGGWLHDFCPLPAHCDCTCHPGGTLR